MEQENIKSILQEALEQEIPVSRIDLWPAVKAGLPAGKQGAVRGGNAHVGGSPRLMRLGLALVLAAVMLAAIFATPQGRSLAQSLLRFFTPAEATSFELEASQLAPEPGLMDEAAPTALPPSPAMSVAEAEAGAGFDAAELPFTPEGFDYLGARLYGDTISIEYQARGLGASLVILQSPSGFNQSEWERVPPEEIMAVKLGDLDAEFAQGTFVVYPGASQATWNPDAPIFRLRWFENGVWFEMAKYGDVEVVEYLDREGMIRLAESLRNTP